MHGHPHTSFVVPEMGIAFAAATAIAGSTARRVLASTRERAVVRWGATFAALAALPFACWGYLISLEDKRPVTGALMNASILVASALIVRRFGLRAIARKTRALTAPAS
jgi:hypothetical protein